MKTRSSFYSSCVFLFILIVWTSSFNHKKEGFVPRINMAYKPHLRKFNTYVTDKIIEANKHFQLYLKRFGLA
jgi:hypothetical protein